jgi:hypothetical protein
MNKWLITSRADGRAPQTVVARSFRDLQDYILWATAVALTYDSRVWSVTVERSHA